MCVCVCICMWASPGSSDGEESTCNARDPSWIPGLGRSHREGNGYPLQYSCLKNSTDRGAWQATVHASQTFGQDWATNTFTFHICVYIQIHRISLKIQNFKKNSWPHWQHGQKKCTLAHLIKCIFIEKVDLDYLTLKSNQRGAKRFWIFFLFKSY